MCLVWPTGSANGRSEGEDSADSGVARPERCDTISQMRRFLLTAVLLAACGGCLSSAKLEFDTLQLGRSLNPDNTIGNHTTAFRPKDTIYAAVLTSSPGAGTIGVRWTFEGRSVGEPSKQVRYKGASATEFSLTNAGGFPVGNYKVEAFIDGEPVGERAFRVEE